MDGLYDEIEVLPAIVRPALGRAGNHIATTYELAEKILEKLPAKDLIVARKVCKSWRGIIARSLSCQKALYKAPGTVNDVSPDALSPKFLNGSRVTKLAREQWGRACLAKIRGGIIVNPLIISSSTAWVDKHCTHLALALKKECVKLALQGGEPGEMHFTQPPLQTFALWYHNGERQRMMEGVSEGTLGDILGRLGEKIGPDRMVDGKQDLILDVYLPGIRFAYT